MRKQTTKGLFGLVFGLPTAAGTFKALDHHTTAFLLFVAALLPFFMAASLWIVQRLSGLRINPRGTSDKPPTELPLPDTIEKAIKEQEAARPVVPIASPFIDHELNKRDDLSSPLSEIRIAILIAIARYEGSCLVDELAEWFELQGNPLNPVKLDRNLNDLQEQGYVTLHQSPVDFPRCSLTQKGRELLDDNRLLDGDRSSH